MTSGRYAASIDDYSRALTITLGDGPPSSAEPITGRVVDAQGVETAQRQSTEAPVETAATVVPGHQELDAARADGYRAETWRFIELILGESIVVACPACNTATVRRWTRQHETCPGCQATIIGPS